MIKHRKEVDSLASYSPGKNISEICRDNGLKEIQRLHLNENPYGCSPDVKLAVLKALDEASFYPDAYSGELRNLLAKKHKIDENQILFGNGGDEIIYMLGKAFIEEGSEVITGTVTFFSYEESVLAMGGQMKYIPMINHGFDLEGILKEINDKTRMIILCNPNNPTGTFITHGQQLEFLRKIPDDVLVVIDEAYAEFFAGEEFPDSFSMLDEFKNIIILKTFSKIYGLASFRIGYAAANKEVIDLICKIKNFFNISSAAVAAATAALGDKNHIAMVKEKNREAINYLYGRLDKMKLSYVPTQTSFMLIKVNASSKEIGKKLIKKGVIVRPGSVFAMDDYIRVSIGTKVQMEIFADALEAILNE